MEGGDFWNDNDKAQKVIAESNQLKVWTVPYNNLKTRFEDVRDLLPEADESGDEALVAELIGELDFIEKSLADLEVRRMLSGELDNKNCYLSINAGAAVLKPATGLTC